MLEDVDSKYILVSKQFASELFESGNLVSAIELDVDDQADTYKIQKELEASYNFV